MNSDRRRQTPSHPQATAKPLRYIVNGQEYSSEEDFPEPLQRLLKRKQQFPSWNEHFGFHPPTVATMIVVLVATMIVAYLTR